MADTHDEKKDGKNPKVQVNLGISRQTVLIVVLIVVGILLGPRLLDFFGGSDVDTLPLGTRLYQTAGDALNGGDTGYWGTYEGQIGTTIDPALENGQPKPGLKRVLIPEIQAGGNLYYLFAYVPVTTADGEAQGTGAIVVPEVDVQSFLRNMPFPLGTLLWFFVAIAVSIALWYWETGRTELHAEIRTLRVTSADGLEGTANIQILFAESQDPEARRRGGTDGARNALSLGFGNVLTQVGVIAKLLNSTDLRSDLPVNIQKFDWATIDWPEKSIGFKLQTVLIGEGGVNFDEKDEKTLGAGAKGKGQRRLVQNLFNLNSDENPTPLQAGVAALLGIAMSGLEVNVVSNNDETGDKS